MYKMDMHLYQYTRRLSTSSTLAEPHHEVIPNNIVRQEDTQQGAPYRTSQRLASALINNLKTDADV